ARQRPFTVVNLGYNNEGAYSMRFTLEDYAYLDYDLACLYEGYNDLNTPNLAVFRHDSPVFRLTGDMPLFPIVFKEKAAAMLNGGDGGGLYGDSTRSVFHASVADRAAAGILDATAAVGQSLERQLGRVTQEGRRTVVHGASTGCSSEWQHYCGATEIAVEYALSRGKQVLVITEPYETQPAVRVRHREQQAALVSMLSRRFAGEARVNYVNLGDAVNLDDVRLSFDHMHLTAAGNSRVGNALIEPVGRM